jgi:hypothetical protein
MTQTLERNNGREQERVAKVSLQQVLDHLAERHEWLHDQLRADKLERRNAPEGERRQELETRNAFNSITMMALRDVGKFILGIDPTEDDRNPFGGPDDF